MCLNSEEYTVYMYFIWVFALWIQWWRLDDICDSQNHSDVQNVTMTVTVNISDILINDLENLRYLQHHERNFLSFSYYTGYIIAVLNFALFLLALALYIQVLKAFFT